MKSESQMDAKEREALKYQRLSDQEEAEERWAREEAIANRRPNRHERRAQRAIEEKLG